MNLSELFIRRPVMTILVMCSILFTGIVSYTFLPVSDLPNVDLPTIEVSVGYPGASPETMANAVTTPLEQQFMTIDGIQSVFSTSSTGSSSIILQFVLNRNIDAASTDVQAAISRAGPNLPTNLPNPPTYQKVNPSATPILYLSLTSPNMTLGDLYDYAHTFLGTKMSMVTGVSQVQIYGAPYAVRIQVDPEKLAAKNLGLDAVVEKIRLTNVDLPVGTLYGPRDDFTIDVDGQILKAAGYNELIIKNDNGDLVKLKDIGQAIDSVANDKYFQNYTTAKGSQPCVILAIQRLPNGNTVQIIQSIHQTLHEMKSQLPNSLQIETIYDKSASIVQGLDDVKITLFIAFLLVIFVIYLSLGKGLNTLIPSLSLPLAILGTFSVIYFLGFSLDILSLLALTLSIGFLVDDSIVVLENNVRHVQLGKTPLDAAVEGSKEISTTVLSMTLCLTAAFIPLLFMEGVVGKLFREFAFTITVAVLISGFISLSLIPLLSARLIKPYAKEEKTKMEKFSDTVNHWLLSLYEPSLHFAMKHRVFMLSSALFCILFSGLLYKAVHKDFLPPDDVGFLQGFTLARDGTSPFLMHKYHDEIQKIAMQDPNIDTILSFGAYSSSNSGLIFLALKPFHQRKPMGQVIEELGEKLHHIPGVNVFLSPLPLIDLQVGSTAQALYQYSLTSVDRDALYNYAPTLVAKMKGNPAFSQVSSDLRIRQPEWDIHILREKASNYHVDVSAIESYFQYAYSDNKISQINAEINQYDVIVETLPRFYQDPTVLSKLYISSTKGYQVPLSEIVEVKETVGPLTINHINGLATVGISFNPGHGLALGDCLDTLNKLAKEEIPPQVNGRVIGTADIFTTSFKSLNFLLCLAFFIIYIILGILYESFIHPLTVMSALPPAILGGLLTIYLFGETLSIYSFVGLILLIGIVLKNGIMMIDFAIVAQEQGKSAYDAIIEACLIRFRPILMTTVCAIMGGVPIALGVGGAMAQTRISLGLCIVGGLLISQLITLLITPVLYYYFEILQEKMGNHYNRPR